MSLAVIRMSVMTPLTKAGNAGRASSHVVVEKGRQTEIAFAGFFNITPYVHGGLNE